MNCPFCNAEISAEDKICPTCGAPVNEETAEVAEAPVAETPAVDPGKKLGLIAMIVGIAGLALGAILSCACACLGAVLPALAAVAAIVLGVLAMKKSKDAGFSNKQALVGIITGGAAIVVIIVFIILNAVLGGAMGLIMQNM